VPELNYLFNAIFIGQLGTMELALVGITGVYYLIFTAIAYGLNNALISIMSRRAGQGELSKISNYFFHGLFLSFILSVSFILLTWVLIEPLLYFCGLSLDQCSMGASFLKIRILGILPFFIYLMCSGFVISIGKTRLLMITTLVAAVSNIVLDYGLIFGHFGFNANGFNGAAIASVCSEVIALIVMLLLIYFLKLFKKNNLSTKWSFDIAALKLIWQQGLPLMSQFAISILAWWFFFILVGRNYDYESQAITQAMRNVFGLTGVFSWAFGSATNTIISNVIGQGREDDVVKLIKKINAIAVSGMLILAIALNIWPETFLSLYGQPISFIEKAYGPLRIVTSAMILLVFGVVWINAVVGTAKNKVVLLIETMSISAYSIYIYIVIEVMKLNITVAWMSEWVYWLVMLVSSYWYIVSDRWKGHTI
jgi:putative MATE family efflux protein